MIKLLLEIDSSPLSCKIGSSFKVWFLKVDITLLIQQHKSSYIWWSSVMTLQAFRHSILEAFWYLKALGHSDFQALEALEGTLFSKLLTAILSYFATLLSNLFGSIHKSSAPLVFVPLRQMRETGKGNRFCSPTPWFTFDLPGKDSLSLGNSQKLNLYYNYKNFI